MFKIQGFTLRIGKGDQGFTQRIGREVKDLEDWDQRSRI